MDPRIKVGSVVGYMGDSADDGNSRVVVSLDPLAWVYAGNGGMMSDLNTKDVSYMREATPAERVAAGLPAEDVKNVEGRPTRIWSKYGNYYEVVGWQDNGRPICRNSDGSAATFNFAHDDWGPANSPGAQPIPAANNLCAEAEESQPIHLRLLSNRYGSDLTVGKVYTVVQWTRSGPRINDDNGRPVILMESRWEPVTSRDATQAADRLRAAVVDTYARWMAPRAWEPGKSDAAHNAHIEACKALDAHLSGGPKEAGRG